MRMALSIRVDGLSTASAGANTTMPAFRTFFPLAGLHAVFVASLWPLALVAGDLPLIDRSRLGAWHATELIYGYVPAVFAGFILTALPRWTGEALLPPPPVRVLAALWLAGRVGAVVALASGIGWPGWIGALFPIALAVLIGRYIVAARNRRNSIVAILLALFALGAAVQSVGGPGDDARLGQRIGIAAALGLVVVFGGRITPALTDTVLAVREDSTRCVRRRLIEIPAALLATTALASWVVAPGALVTAGLSAAAALGQSLRLAQWRGRSVIRIPNVWVFHAAYAGVPLGFALTALASFSPSAISAEAGIHAWTMGAIALMSLAVMTSMVRRQMGHPFESSPSANAAYLLAGAAVVCRVGVTIEPLAANALLMAAVLSWLAAFGLLLVFLVSRLLRDVRSIAQCSASSERTMSAENGRGDCR
jgi:uncharacterized protein involved in response to NO